MKESRDIPSVEYVVKKNQSGSAFPSLDPNSEVLPLTGIFMETKSRM